MLKKYFIAGLFFWLPLILIFFLAKFFLDVFDQMYYWLPPQYRLGGVFENYIPGIGALLFLLLTVLTGFLAVSILGTKLMQFWESLLEKVPVLGKLYSAIRQILLAFSQSSDSFQQVVLTQYPREGTYVMAFKTNEFVGDDHKRYVSIFVPTTPNPTSGFLLISRDDQVVRLDISVEEAFKIIISGGVVIDKVQWENLRQKMLI